MCTVCHNGKCKYSNISTAIYFFFNSPPKLRMNFVYWKSLVRLFWFIFARINVYWIGKHFLWNTFIWNCLNSISINFQINPHNFKHFYADLFISHYFVNHFDSKWINSKLFYCTYNFYIYRHSHITYKNP